MADLMSIGEILTEIMAAKNDQTFLKPGTFIGPFASGAPAICIDQAARLGASCGLIACVGDDDFGTLNINRLAEDGVDVSGIVRLPGKTTGVAFVTYDSEGNRKFIFHFADAAAGSLSESMVDSSQFEGTKILHIMGCSLSAGNTMRTAVLKAVKICKERGATLSFDPNIRPELLGLEEIRAAFSYVMDNADILLTGAEELTSLMSAPLEAAIKRQRDKGTEIIVLKSGSKGARVITKDTDAVIKPFKVHEVDPTGAGDCFDGAFLASLLDKKLLMDAALIASAAGAHSVTHRGPMEGAALPEDIQRIMVQ